MDVHWALTAEARETIPRQVHRRLQCVAARRRHALRTAFGLVYDRYVRDGLATWNQFGLRILPHQLLETSWVLLAKRGRRCLGTLSLIEDGAMGLPIEQLYPAEIWQMRRQQMRVAELACFASLDHSASQSMAVLRALLQSACEIACRRQIEQLVICVHPRRAPFYERRLGFEECGPLRCCPWVCDQPAVAMRLNLRATSNRVVALALRDSCSAPALAATESTPLRRADRAYFRRLLDETASSARPCRTAA